MKKIAIGFLGTTLDQGVTESRWTRWRPTLSLLQHEDFLIDRVELLFAPKFKALAETVAADAKSVSPKTQIRFHEIKIDDHWDFENVYGALFDFARAYPFDLENEEYFVHITTGTHVAQICEYLLTESRHLPAKLIQTSPGDNKSERAKGEYSVIDLDLSKYDAIARRFRKEVSDGVSFLKSGIATKNEKFNTLIENIERVAIRSASPLLFMGATGAGKSQLAKRVYELKKSRAQVTGAFVAVNCATLRGETAMSTLFGHVKGAFTGAQKDRPGLMREAHGGVLFLDEIGELGPDEQAMLLKAIEEKRFFPMGGDHEVESHFQLIAGTNRDLGGEVAKGVFREDLFSRINLWTFTLPALNERIEDIEANLSYELERFAEQHGSNVTFNKEARDVYLSFARSPQAAWKANFRDLNASVTRLATLAPGGRIDKATVSEEIDRLIKLWQTAPVSNSHDVLAEILNDNALAALDLIEKAQLAEVIRVCRSCRNLSEAGRRLYNASRTQRSSTNDADRLRKFLARYDLSWDQICH